MAGRFCRCTLAPPEYSSAIAVKMLNVPRVTMNGGSFSRVTSSAVDQTAQGAEPDPEQQREAAGHAVVGGEIRHDQHRQDADRTDREVDAGGQDDQGLTDGQGGDHRRLLQDDRDRRPAARTAD